MKVVVVSSMYVREDKISANFVHRQVVELVRLGVDARVVCPIPRFSAGGAITAGFRKEPGRAALDGVEVTYLPYWNVPHRISARLDAESLRRALEAYLRSIRPIHDFELIHSFRLFPTGYAALRVARKLGVPVVVGARGSDVHTHPRRNRGIARCTRVVIGNGDRILSVSQGLARRIPELGRPREPVEVVYNGVDIDRFRPAPDRAAIRRSLGLPETGVGIAFVGRLVAEKGLWELVHAFDSIARAKPGAWLAIVGTGPIRHELEGWRRARGLEGRILFPGAQPHDRVAEWLNASDIFVLPSYDEGLPNGVLEAMACGLPVVATDVGGIPEAVTHGENGLLVPPRAVPPLVAALTELIRDPALRDAMGRAALDRIRTRFLWHRSAEHLLRIYRELVATHGPGGRPEAAREGDAPRRPAAHVDAGPASGRSEP